MSAIVSGPMAEAPEEPGSLEGQLRSLYAERELLTAEVGTADAEELIALVRELRVAAETLDASLVMQVESLYAERDQVQQQLGVSSADDILELVRRLSAGNAPRTVSN